MTGKRFCFLLNTLLLSTSGVVAQDGDFYKQMLKESMKETLKETMKPQPVNTGLLKNDSDEKNVKVEVDPKKIKIPIFASFNYKQDSIKNKIIERVLQEKILTISPGFFEAYKNLPFDAYYDETPVFTDGKWVPKSALPGAGIGPMTIVAILFKTGIVKYDPLPPSDRPKSRKEKALDQLREAYGTITTGGKWNGDVKELNDAINKLREEVEKENKLKEKEEEENKDSE